MGFSPVIGKYLLSVFTIFQYTNLGGKPLANYLMIDFRTNTGQLRLPQLPVQVFASDLVGITAPSPARALAVSLQVHWSPMSAVCRLPSRFIEASMSYLCQHVFLQDYWLAIGYVDIAPALLVGAFHRDVLISEISHKYCFCVYLLPLGRKHTHVVLVFLDACSTDGFLHKPVMFGNSSEHCRSGHTTFVFQLDDCV